MKTNKTLVRLASTFFLHVAMFSQLESETRTK